MLLRHPSLLVWLSLTNLALASPFVRAELPDLITADAEENTHTLTATDGNHAVLILDYEHSVEGIPEFVVAGSEGDSSVFEITYAESKAALDNYMVRGNDKTLEKARRGKDCISYQRRY